MARGFVGVSLVAMFLGLGAAELDRIFIGAVLFLGPRLLFSKLVEVGDVTHGGRLCGSGGVANPEAEWEPLV